MDYLADISKLIRRDNVPFWNRPHQPRTAGRLRVVPLFSLAARRKRRGEDETGTSRRTGRMGEDFERKKEELEDGQRDFEEGETRLSKGRKQDF